MLTTGLMQISKASFSSFLLYTKKTKPLQIFSCVLVDKCLFVVHFKKPKHSVIINLILQSNRGQHNQQQDPKRSMWTFFFLHAFKNNNNNKKIPREFHRNLNSYEEQHKDTQSK